MPRLKSDHSEIHYITKGFGKPILFVHGSGCDSSLWDFQVSELSKEFSTLVIDLNGHGASPIRDGEAMHTYSQDVLSLMRTLSEPCVLIGHSLGSAIVQTVALEKPKNLAALVLIGAGAKLRVHPQLLETIENDFPKAIEVITNWSFHPAAKPDLLQRSRDHMHRNGKKILARDFRACDGFNVMERLKEMQIPTLIICGREDQLTPVKYSEYLKSNLSRAELQIIQNAGHRVMEEQAEQVNHAIQNFAHALSYKSV